MKRPIVKEIVINPVKWLIVIALVANLLALEWFPVLLLVVIAGYEWGYLHGDKRQ